MGAKPARPFSRGEKLGLFVIGFMGFFLVNGVASVLTAWLTSTGNAADRAAANLLVVALYPLNILVLVVAAIIRPSRWAALGMLAALALVLCVVLIVAVAAGAYCFYSLSCNGRTC